MKFHILTNIIFIIIISLFVSCNSNKNEPAPPSIIPHEKMVMLLTEVYQSNAQAEVDNAVLVKSFGKTKYAKAILKKFGEDSLRFDKSISYYSANIKEFNEMMDEVIWNLSEKESKFKSDTIKK